MKGQISQLAEKFCDFHNAGLSKGQIQMIEDGLPPAYALTDEQRRAARNLTTALTTHAETAKRLAPPETEAMKKIAAAAKKAASKKNIHVPKKPKLNPKLPSTHPVNRGAKKTAVSARRTLKAAATKPSTDGTSVSRKDQVIAIMKAPGGTTVDSICTATGMLPHSARALISGIAKTEKVATSKEAGAKTVYCIK